MTKRSYLDGRIVLLGESDGKTFQRSFTISRRLREGGDGVAYEAYHEKSGKGVLKEYYPCDGVLLLERDAYGHLGHKDDIKVSFERFKEAKAAFIRPYDMLLDLKRKNDDGELATFIPPFELYYGSSDDETFESTVYIWMPEPVLETYETICEEIHNRPDDRPEHKLVTVLRSIETLTKCICTLHSTGIIHRDIKPSNFGFRSRGGETLTQSISLFDIDSLCSVWADNHERKFTKGFSEPEAEYEDCTNQTDIYSIGATLFSSIIVTEETKANGYIYDASFYEQISELVAGSELIIASEANSHPRLRKILSEILKKCLCDREARYARCEDLLEDIRQALFYALPPEITKKNRNGEKWVLTKADKLLDANADKNSYLAIQYHLYEHPLYKALEADQDTLRICVIGFDNYAQKFLDACLQTGQMRRASLDVRIIAADEEDMTLYLEERPSLGDFFNIEVQTAERRMTEPSYGRITFCSGPEVAGADISSHVGPFAEYACSLWGDAAPHYVFASTGEDRLSSRIAAQISKNIRKAGRSCLVSYACEKDRHSGNSDILPVMVSGKTKNTDIHKEIERMAFNTHLVWERSLNLDYDAIRKEFKRKYNHDSCVSSVISLKYKLYELGIDTDKVTLAEAAEAFQSVISGDSRSKAELMWVEHRRWVTEKILLGWKAMSDLSACLTGKTKNERTKEHVCIVRSRADQMLTELASGSGIRAAMNTLSDTDADKLDDLDRMSVELHRLYDKRAGEIKKSNILNDPLIAAIRAAADKAGAIGIFNEWFACVRRLLADDSTAAALYKGLEKELIDAAGHQGTGDQETDERELLIREMNVFRSKIYPLTASLIPHDWKQEDAAFIDNIPFVLTYSDGIWLTVPFNAGIKASDRFMNVAAALTVRPKKIVFIYTAKRRKDMLDAERSLGVAIRLMEQKRIRAAVDFVCFYGDDCDPEAFDAMLRSCGSGRVRDISFVHIDNAPEWAEKYIQKNVKRNRKALSAAEKNHTPQSGLLQELGIYDQLPWYINSADGIQTGAASGSKPLEYIRKRTILTVAEMLHLGEGAVMTADAMDYSDAYESLLAISHEMPAEWSVLFSAIKRYSSEHDRLASFKVSEISRKDPQNDPHRNSQGGREAQRFIIPASSLNGVNKIIALLSTHGVIGKGSSVSRYTSDAYEVIAYVGADHRCELEELLGRVYALGSAEALSVRTSEDGDRTDILFDDLMVSGMQTDETGAKGEIGTWALLERLRDERLLIALRKEAAGVSFTFASAEIKALLADENRIREMQVYYSLRNSGNYDDVVLGELAVKKASSTERHRCCIAAHGSGSTVITFDDAEDDTFDKAGNADNAAENRSRTDEAVSDQCINAVVLTAEEYLSECC